MNFDTLSIEELKAVSLKLNDTLNTKIALASIDEDREDTKDIPMILKAIEDKYSLNSKEAATVFNSTELQEMGISINSITKVGLHQELRDYGLNESSPLFNRLYEALGHNLTLR